MAQTQVVHKTQSKVRYPNRYNIVFHNDDYTPMDFVVTLLVEIFNKNITQANEITMQIHTEQAAVVGTYSKEVAEQKLNETKTIISHSGYQLKVTLEAV